MKDLVQKLEEATDRLTLTVVEEMYRNPFWNDRFGARGRKFAEEDGRHHLSHLAQALAAGDAALMTVYARWLQSVLTSRGICSRLLAQNFQCLAAAIGNEKFPGGEVAIEYLARAEAALEYPEGEPGELVRASGRLAERAASLVYERHPDWAMTWGPPGKARCASDGLYHLSYLADSLALGRPLTFSSYCAWMSGFLERLGMSPGHLAEILRALVSGVETDEALSPGLKRAALQTLAGGLEVAAVPAGVRP